MRNDKAGASLGKFVHGPLDQQLRAGIHAEVASSRIRIFGSEIMVRAMVSSCFAPG